MIFLAVPIFFSDTLFFFPIVITLCYHSNQTYVTRISAFSYNRKLPSAVQPFVFSVIFALPPTRAGLGPGRIMKGLPRSEDVRNVSVSPNVVGFGQAPLIAGGLRVCILCDLNLTNFSFYQHKKLLTAVRPFPLCTLCGRVTENDDCCSKDDVVSRMAIIIATLVKIISTAMIAQCALSESSCVYGRLKYLMLLSN